MSAVDVAAALQLAAAESALGHGAVERGELLVVERDVEARRVAGDEAVGRAEEPPQRLPGDLRLEVPQGGVERSDAAERRPGVTGLEDPGEHAVVEGRDGARILSVDRREDAVDALVRTGGDPGDAFVGVDDHDRNLGDAGVDESIDVADGTTPVVIAAQQAVARDLHHRP